MATPTPTSTHPQQASPANPGVGIDDATKTRLTQLNHAFSAVGDQHQLDTYLITILHHSNKLYLQTFFQEGSETTDLNQRVDAFIQTFKSVDLSLPLESSNEYLPAIAKIYKSNKPLGATLLFNSYAKKIRLALGDPHKLTFDQKKAIDLQRELQGKADNSIRHIASVVFNNEYRKKVTLYNEYLKSAENTRRKIMLLKEAFQAAASLLGLNMSFTTLMQNSAELYAATFLPKGSTTEYLPLRVFTFFKEFKDTQQLLLSLAPQQRKAQLQTINTANKPLFHAIVLSAIANETISAFGDLTKPTINMGKLKQLEEKFQNHPDSNIRKVSVEFLRETFQKIVAQIRPSHQGGGAAVQPLPERTLKLTPSKHQIDAETKSNELKRKREAKDGKRPLHAAASDLADNGSQASLEPDLNNSKRLKADETEAQAAPIDETEAQAAPVDETEAQQEPPLYVTDQRLPSPYQVIHHTSNKHSLRTKVLAQQSYQAYQARQQAQNP